MKKFIYLMMAFSLVTFASCNKDTKPDDENDTAPETARILENFENGGMLTWTGSNGCVFEIVANPAKGGINTSDHVGKYTTADAEWDFVWTTAFGVTETVTEPTFLNFTNDGFVIKVDVYSPAAGILIYCKLEGFAAGSPEIQDVRTTKANEWETLEYDFETFVPYGLVDGEGKNFVFCVDAGGTTPGTVVYMDNIRQVKGE